MPQIYLYTFASVLAVSLISFIGALALALNPERLKKITLFLVSLSAGTLLGGAILHLIPEIAEHSGGASAVWLMLAAGIIAFFVLEKIICWRHCHIPTSRDHPHPLGAMNLAGDALHNLIDGMIIAGSFLVSPALGLATTVAVIAHEIPQEIGDFGVLIHAGYSRRRALFLNFLIALAAALGALAVLVIGVRIENFSSYILPFTAGGFIYIAASDLMPELRKDSHPGRSVLQLLIIILGFSLMWLLTLSAH